MHALAVIYVLRAVPGIAQFKCVQHALGGELQLPALDAELQRDRQAIVMLMRSPPGGSAPGGSCAVLEEILPEASGKHRYVVSHVPLAESLKQAAA